MESWKPLLIINFKEYSQALGESGKDLARSLEKVAAEFLAVETVLAVKPPEIPLIAETVSLPIFSQYTLPDQPSPLFLRRMGASGTLLNHSDHPLAMDLVEELVGLCQEQDLMAVACAASLDEIRQIVSFHPDYIAYEPPELIGGEVSVTTARPEIITAAVALVREIPLLVGAGVKTGADVARGLELGAKGVLVSSGVVLAADPTAALKDIMRGFSSNALPE